VTVFLKALGWTADRILEEFGTHESIRQTLEKDHGVETQDQALLDIYKKLRPGEPPSRDAAQGAHEVDSSDDVVDRQNLLIEGQGQTELLVDLVPTNLGQVVALRVEVVIRGRDRTTSSLSPTTLTISVTVVCVPSAS
jgi:hypothetical protein